MTDTESPTMVAALLAVQREMPKIPKLRTNPHFKSTYMALDDLLDGALPVLNKHGFVFIQSATALNGAPALRTRLVHAPTGEEIEDVTPMLLVKDDPQGHGAALTYYRRYSAAALLAIASEEDDDGNHSSQARQNRSPAQQGPAPTLRSRVQELVAAGVPDANDLFKDVAEAVYAVRPEKASDLDSAQRADAIRRLGIVVQLVGELGEAPGRDGVLAAFAQAWDGILVSAWAEPDPVLESTVDAEAEALADAMITGPSQ